jgi:hypothetical protein
MDLRLSGADEVAAALMRKKRLSQQYLRAMGASPGRLATRYSPDGERAEVRQLTADAYLADRPTARRRWKSYVEARQAAEPTNLEVLASVVGPQRPAEIGG